MTLKAHTMEQEDQDDKQSSGCVYRASKALVSWEVVETSTHYINNALMPVNIEI